MIHVQRPGLWRERIPYRLLSVLVSGLLVVAGIAIMYHRIDWREVATVWTNLDPYLVAAAAALYWLQYPINAIRLRQVILWTASPSSPAPSFKFLFKLTCSSAFVAVAAPIGLAGDAAKIAALRLFGSLSTTEAARSVLFDRVVGVQCLSIIGLAMIAVQVSIGIDWAIILPQLVLFGGLIAGVGLLLVFPRALAWFGHHFIDRIARVFAGYRAILLPERLAIQLIIALVNFLLASGTLYLLLRAGGLNSDIWIVAGFIPLLQLVNGLPFLYMGWGGRELAMTLTLGVASNLTVNETLGISIAWGVVLIVTGAINCIFLPGDWELSGRGSPTDGGGTDHRQIG